MCLAFGASCTAWSRYSQGLTSFEIVRTCGQPARGPAGSYPEQPPSPISGGASGTGAGSRSQTGTKPRHRYWEQQGDQDPRQ